MEKATNLGSVIKKFGLLDEVVVTQPWPSAYILTRETGLSPVLATGRLICAWGWDFVSHLKTGLMVDK